MNIITALTALMLLFALCPLNCGNIDKGEKHVSPPPSVQELYIVTPDAIIYPQSDDYEVNK